MKYIKLPNLPTQRVSHAVCAYDKELYAALLEHGVAGIHSGVSSHIQNVTRSHADMLCIHLGGRYFMVEQDNDFLKEELRDLGFQVVMAGQTLEEGYPKDCPLNAVLLGNFLLCNPKTVDQSLLRYCANNKFEVITTEQGYTKCNTCIVSKEAVITSDLSIYTALKGKIDVLPIEIGHIELKGYPYGFIGGATGLIDRDKLAFVGDLSLHPSANRIQSFLSNHHIEAISLLPGKSLQDVGSIFPIVEWENG